MIHFVHYYQSIQANLFSELFAFVLEFIFIGLQPNPTQIQHSLALLYLLSKGRTLQLLIKYKLVLKLINHPVTELVPGRDRVVLWRGEQRVKTDPECVLNCTRDNPLEYRTVYLKTGIGIALNQVGFEFAVNEKVKAEQLEVMIFPLGV